MQKIGTVKIETRRLILRPFRVEDAPIMFRNWAGDPVVAEYLTRPHQRSEQETAEVLARRVKQTSEDPFVFHWAIVLKSLGDPIGSLSAVNMNERAESIELGWCIGKPWWGLGIMPEAGAAVIAFLFDDVGVNRIVAEYDTRNARSGRVMQKLGMTCEGVLRQGGVCNAGRGDVAICSILRDEYAGHRAESAKHEKQH